LSFKVWVLKFEFFSSGIKSIVIRGTMEETKMKKNYLVAIAVAALMLAGPVAQAFADISFSGQIRPRLETRDHDFDDDTGSNTFFQTRVRLNAKAKANDQVGAFLQFQSVGTWGFETSDDGLSSGTRVALGGAGDEASDTLNDVGLHQAYLTIKNFYGSSFDLKMGRQEVVIDGHRLYGHTGWTAGAQTNDAIRLTHAAGNHTLSYTFIKGQEEAQQAAQDAHSGADQGDNSDVNHHILHASTQGVLGGSLSGIFVLYDDNAGAPGIDNIGDEWYTIGARQKGKLGGLDYRVEFYHQFGDACGDACGLYAYTTETSAGSVDRDAQMFGVRVGKTLKNAKFSPTITLWYDHLSGTGDGDVTSSNYSTFDTIQDTGHKFYGFMDLYLARNGAKEGRLGLQDFAVKTKISPAAGWTLKADWHQFWTDVDLGESPITAALDISGAGAPGVLTDWTKDLGNELDLTLVHKYNSNAKVVFGYSHYWNTPLFAALNPANKEAGAASNTDNGDSDWAYVMIDTKF